MHRRRQPRGAALLVVLILGAMMILLLSGSIGVALNWQKQNQRLVQDLQQRVDDSGLQIRADD